MNFTVGESVFSVHRQAEVGAENALGQDEKMKTAGPRELQAQRHKSPGYPLSQVH